jgi:hypothetical protein
MAFCMLAGVISIALLGLATMVGGMYSLYWAYNHLTILIH